MNDSLQDIGFKYRTDKSGCNGGSHIFNNKTLLHTYERHFKHLRNLPITLLEIGILDGGSLKMWKDYFPNGNIIGLDIDPDKMKFQSERISIYIGSQNDENILNRIKKENPNGFDIVIDDGSHNPEHQFESYRHFKSHLAKGGIYVIEDIQNIDLDRTSFENIDPEKNVTILDHRHIKNRYDDVMVIIRDKE